MIVASSRGGRGSEKGDKAGDVLTTSGAAADDDTLRRIRRQVMGYGVDVIAGEIAARLTAEAVGSQAKEGDGVSRFKALNDAERIVLLAGQTGAEALLVLDQSGTWSSQHFVEFDANGQIKQLREFREGDKTSGCDSDHPRFVFKRHYIGVRAKLVSLKKEDNAAIIADVDVFKPKVSELAAQDFPKNMFEPISDKRCYEHHLNPATDQWECDYQPEVTSWKPVSAWCNPFREQFEQHQSEIENKRWDQRYDELIGEVLAKLFPEGTDARSRMCSNAKTRAATVASDVERQCAAQKAAITKAQDEAKACPPGQRPCLQKASDKELAARRTFEECANKIAKK
jgi:hypothetical protein